MSVIVALVIQHAKRMHRILFSSVASLAVSFFFALSHKRHNCRKKVIECKTRVSIFSTTFVRNTSNFKKNSARYYHERT